MALQINTKFHNGLAHRMDEFVGEDKPYKSYGDFIRAAVRTKIRELKSKQPETVGDLEEISAR